MRFLPPTAITSCAFLPHTLCNGPKPRAVQMPNDVPSKCKKRPSASTPHTSLLALPQTPLMSALVGLGLTCQATPFQCSNRPCSPAAQMSVVLLPHKASTASEPGRATACQSEPSQWAISRPAAHTSLALALQRRCRPRAPSGLASQPLPSNSRKVPLPPTNQVERPSLQAPFKLESVRWGPADQPELFQRAIVPFSPIAQPSPFEPPQSARKFAADVAPATATV